MATNFWESDAVVKSEDQWWSQDPEAGSVKKEESGFLRQVADVPLSVGRGALTGVRLVADAFGAGSGVSETIKGAEGYLAGLMSAQAKNDEQEIARIMKDAEDKGVGEQVKAAFQAFATAPVDLISQGLGTAAPAVIGLLGGKVLGAGALGARAIGMGVGAGMGAGTAKSAIYEATKEELLKAGLPEAQAEERAQLAQSYGGKNLDQILLSTGLGAFASGTGLESSIKNILFKSGAQDVAKKGALQTAKTLTGKAAMEAVPEVAQGSQEQLAQNIALQREGFDVPTMRGVAGAGALEGLAGAGLGAAGGAFEMGARGQARAEADRILKEEAEAKRVADAAAKKAPVQPSPTQGIEDQAAELERQQQRQTASMERARTGMMGGGSDVNQALLDQARIRKEQQERAAAAQEKAAEAERQKELRAERVRIANTQYSGDPMMNEVLRSRAVAEFDAANKPKVEAPKVPEYQPTKTIEQTTPIEQPKDFNVLRGVDSRGSDFMSAVSERRAKEEAAAAVKTKEAEAQKTQEAAKIDTSRADVDQRVAQVENFLMSPVRKTQQETADYMAGVIPEMQKDFLALLDEDMSQPLTPEQTEALKSQIRQRLQPDFVPDENIQRTPFKKFLAAKGINKKDAYEIFGEGSFRANQLLPGAIRSDGATLDILAEAAFEAGFLKEEDPNALTQMILDEFAGNEQVSVDMSGDRATAAMENERDLDLLNRADAIGLKTKGMTPDQIAARLDRIERKREEKRKQYNRSVDGFADLPTEEQDRIIDMMIDQFGEPQVFDVERAEIEGRVREEEELLQTQTEKQLRDKQAEIDRLAKENERLSKEAERKAKADEEAGDFVLTGSNRVADKAAARGQMELAPSEENVPPVATEMTPKQFFDATMKFMAAENGIPLSEVLEAYDTEGGRADNQREWLKQVEKAANSGEPLTRKTLDKLYELAPSARLPESALPAGYQIPGARKAEAEEKQARIDNRKAVKSQQVQPLDDDTPADYDTAELRLAQSDEFETSLDVLLFQERDSYGYAALKNRKLTDKYALMSESIYDAVDAAYKAFAKKDFSAFKKYEAIFPKTSKRLKGYIDRASGDQDVGDIRYKRATGKVGIGKQAVQDTVDTVKARWANAPEVVVAENMDDPAIPQEVRDHNKEAVAKGAKGSPQGFYYKGKAYVIADSIGSTNEAVEALMHEALGHFGLRGVFGPKMETVLRDVIKNRRAEVESKAEQYGLDPKSDKDMLEAAEEVLAVMAQTKPGLPFVKRAIAVIRNFLRDLGFNIKMSDADIIQKYILPARAFVESGKGRPTEGKPAAMRAPAKAPPTDSAAFKKWFGDSKVVDENGEPLVMYHGTGADVTAFDAQNPRMRNGKLGKGIYLTPSTQKANFFAKLREKDGAPNVMPLYASLKNPLEIYGENNRPVSGMDRGTLQGNGYDGVILYDEAGAMQEIVAFSPTQIKSATGNIGTYDPDNADIRYQRDAEPEAGQPKPTRQNIFGDPVLGSWSIQVDPKMELQDGLIYKLLDKNIDVKRIIEAVKKTGKEIASQWNPYLQEELYHGRTANAALEFQDKEWLPLLKDMEAKGVTIGELEKYLHNRHAEDYNKLVAKRNPNRPEMQDGGSGITTEAARKYLSDLDSETKAKYDELAARVDGITKGTRQLLKDTGYEKAERIEAWEKAFPNYVPLMREEGDFDYNFGSFGTGRGFDVRRDFSRSAMGSNRNVVDIIGNVIAARNNAIALTEKNRVAQAVYGLALEAPNPDFWMAINPEAEKVPEDAIDELRAMGLDEEAADYLMKEPKQRVLDPKRDQIVSRINTKLRENDFVLATRINGEKRYVFFNPKDPRSKRAATALKNLDAQDLGTALGMVAKVTRWMAAVNTQYNPIFGPYNFLRDMQAAALQLSTTELAGQQKEVAANVVPSLKVIYSSLRKRRKGEKVDGEMADLWKEFQKEGGQTGFRDNFSRTQDRTEALLNEMSKITEGKAKAGARAVFDWLSDYNDSLENAVRLSAYKVAKEKFKKEGFSDSDVKQKAASLAKNLTVNFNRKGDVATQMGALYAFFNASMQGSARMIETLKGPTGKKIMAGGLLLGSMQAALLAAAGFDDEEPPEFIRSKNIVIPTGDGNYVAFPMPLGFHVIPGLSRILTEWTLSGFDDTARRVTDLTGLFLDAFNPIGNAGWSVQTVTPTVLDPFVALGENKDWTGKPISKEDIFSLRPTPGYTRAREGANWLSKELSEFLNYASGGTKYQPGVLSPTPEQIEYLVGQVFGGVGREAIKLTTSIEKTATGEDLPPYKIPLYGRFVGETKSSAAESNKFYKNMERLNRLDLEVKGRREDREPIGDFMRENPETRLLPLANKTYKDVQALRKRREALLEKGAPKESIQAVERMITRRMQVLNDRVKAMKQ
jgi:hypothetical protein